MTHEPLTTVCDCGHTVTAQVPGGTGYARTPDGRTLCYACADDAQREDMRTADVFTAYLSTQNWSVTTWSGGKLGTVTGHHVSRRAHKTYVQVTDVHGARWHGVGPAESGTYVTLRRSKVRAAKRTCAFVSDGTPGQGDHHSEDIVAVYHGATEPVYVCGFHASRPDIMAKVYASLGER